MNNYRYQLEKYSGRNSRYTCPACGKAHRFTRYIDTETGQHLAPHVGRCDREVECGYHYKPKEYFADTPQLTPPGNRHKTQNYIPRVPQHTQHFPSWEGRRGGSVHNAEQVSSTLCDYEQNHLIRFLTRKLGQAAVQGLAEQYRIGTHHHWQGSTVYWYIGRGQQVCSGKVMLYDTHTGKRVKEPFPHITWMHSLLGMEGFSRRPCFFGEHLLTASGLPVSIVESEKTALVAAHYLPQSLWLATGGIGGLNIAHARQVLKGRKVTLFPDAGAYHKWKELAAQLPNCNTSTLADDFWYSPGNDLCDLLLRA